MRCGQATEQKTGVASSVVAAEETGKQHRVLKASHRTPQKLHFPALSTDYLDGKRKARQKRTACGSGMRQPSALDAPHARSARLRLPPATHAEPAAPGHAAPALPCAAAAARPQANRSRRSSRGAAGVVEGRPGAARTAGRRPARPRGGPLLPGALRQRGLQGVKSCQAPAAMLPPTPLARPLSL